jgi:hypothetical protein
MIILCISLAPSKMVKIVDYRQFPQVIDLCPPWYQHGLPAGMKVSTRLARGLRVRPRPVGPRRTRPRATRTCLTIAGTESSRDLL